MSGDDVKAVLDGVMGFALLLMMAVLIGSAVGWLAVQAITRIFGWFDT